MDLTVQVKKKAQELGADLTGIAPIERFNKAPLRMSPQGLLPQAKSVIVMAIHHPDASVELGGEPTPHDQGPYAAQCSAMNPKLDDISFFMARFLEEMGYVTLPISASNIWRYKGYKDLKVDFAPDMAHRYAAVAAGLAEIGWNGLALTPEFGPRQRFVSVITEAELEPTPMYEGEPLCDRCMECVKNCPTDAFRKEVKKVNEIEIGGRKFQFPDTNKWRCGWAENFCLDLALPKPEKINEDVILEMLQKYGPRGGEEGSCLKFCMVPEKRYYEKNYCRAPRRKKTPAPLSQRKLLSAVEKISDDLLIDVMTVLTKEAFDGLQDIHPKFHLPDAATAISLGVSLPEADELNEETRYTLSRQKDYAAFSIAHYLDLKGYSAVSGTRIDNIAVAQRAGIHQSRMLFATVLTSAELPSMLKKRKPASTKLTPSRIRSLCRTEGADLVGFFNSRRFTCFQAELKSSGLIPETQEDVRDTSFIYLPPVPEVHKREVKIKELTDHLPGAQSVIVLGLHYPDSAIDTAKVTPAETTGPFAFVQYETLRLLHDTGSRIIKRLNDAGYRAVMTDDLTGTASHVNNPRGMIPDMRSNRFAALLSGVAYIGAHGYPITEEFGVRQRFLTIVTDYPLPNDPLYQGDIACRDCSKLCIEACPTHALDGKTAEIVIEGKTFAIPAHDQFACDWVKKYCLSGKECADYLGIDIDLPLPEKKDGAAVAQALKSVKWGVQKRLMSLAEECIRVCPAKGQKLLKIDCHKCGM